MSAAFLPQLPLVHSRRHVIACSPRRSARRFASATATPPSHGSPEPSPSSDTAPTRDASATTIDAETRPVPLQSLKADLYLQLSSSSLGFSVPASQKSQINSLITSLESRNPTQATSYSSLLSGRWRLIYTTARDVLSLSLLSPFVNTGRVYQNIRRGDSNDAFEIENLVYFRPPFAPIVDVGIEGLLKVQAKGVITGDDRVDLTFEKAFLRQTSFIGVEIPENLALGVPLGEPVGYLDTTFLDEDIRIGRAPMVGANENVFVLAREE